MGIKAKVGAVPMLLQKLSAAQMGVILLITTVSAVAADDIRPAPACDVTATNTLGFSLGIEAHFTLTLSNCSMNNSLVAQHRPIQNR